MATERRLRLSLRKWRASPLQMVPSTPVCFSAEKSLYGDKEAVVPQMLARDLNSPDNPSGSSGVRDPPSIPVAPVLELSTPCSSQFSLSPSTQPSPLLSGRVLVPDTPDTDADTDRDVQIVPSVEAKLSGRERRRARAASILHPKKSSNVPVLNLFDFSTDYDIFA